MDYLVIDAGKHRQEAMRAWNHSQVLSRESPSQSCPGSSRHNLGDQTSQVAHWGRKWPCGGTWTWRTSRQSPAARRHPADGSLGGRRRLKPAFILTKSVSGSEETLGMTQTKRLCEDNVNTWDPNHQWLPQFPNHQQLQGTHPEMKLDCNVVHMVLISVFLWCLHVFHPLSRTWISRLGFWLFFFLLGLSGWPRDWLDQRRSTAAGELVIDSHSVYVVIIPCSWSVNV